MLQINVIRENPQEIISRLAIKNFDASELVEKIIALDHEKKRNTKEIR